MNWPMFLKFIEDEIADCDAMLERAASPEIVAEVKDIKACLEDILARAQQKAIEVMPN